MNNKRVLMAVCVAVVMSVASCSGGKTKSHKAEQDKPAQPVMEQQVEAGKDAAAVVNVVVNRTPAQLLAAIPCKMQNKKGVFAVFPENTMAGQICFKLNPANGTEQNIPVFNIQSGGMYIIFHDNSGMATGDVSLMKWTVKDGVPCLEDDCGKAIMARSESYAAPDEPGWNYIIVTPEQTIDLASVSDGDMGLVVGTEKYLPLFQ